MKFEALFSFAFLLIGVFSAAEDCATVKCPPVPKHYKEFGCVPVVDEGKCCPSHFDCSAFKNRDASKCFHNNQVFNVSEEVAGPEIESSCSASCQCIAADELRTKASFHCTHIDCPEFFKESEIEKEKSENCVDQYELNRCCSTSTVCGERLKELATCDVGGKIYYEGQQIDTGHSCFSCLCGKNYEDKSFEENPHCRPINCNMELHYSIEFSNGCIPVYFNDSNCCPIDWRCPSENTTVITADPAMKNVSGDVPLQKCMFGHLSMNVGDSLSPWESDVDQCTTCTCSTPPYAHCIKTFSIIISAKCANDQNQVQPGEQVRTCDNYKCPSYPKHYEELGCVSMIKEGECCPTFFDCSAFKNRDQSKCYYKNQIFNIGEEVGGEDIEASCTVGCSCQRPYYEGAASKFRCGHIDCPEFLRGPIKKRGKKCISQYSSKQCCSTGAVCGEALNKLAKCVVGDQTYYEGERIDTGESCYSCLCSKDWENKPFEENKHCKKVNCNIDLHYSQRLLSGCIPVYYQSHDCCPIDWRCPDEISTVVPDQTRQTQNNDDRLQCKFGSLTMNIGDSLSPWEDDYDQCTICKCKTPPFAHCIKTC